MGIDSWSDVIFLVMLLGWFAGVLVNALADSLPAHRRLVLPHCPACSAPYPFPAWSGLLAFLGGWQRCAYCDTSRQWRALLVELVGMGAFVWLFQRQPAGPPFWAGVIVLFVFLLIIVIDVEHRLILHITTAPAALLLAVVGTLSSDRSLGQTLLGGVVGFVLVMILYLLGGVFARIFGKLRGEPIDEVAFGFGDVTLSTVIGLLVGPYGVIVAIFSGIFAAGIFSILFLVISFLRRRYQAFMAIPYGPFLVLGALLVYFGGRTAFERIIGG